MTYEQFKSGFTSASTSSFSEKRIRLIWLAGEARLKTKINTPLHEREQILRSILEKEGFDVSNYSEEKPHTGSAFSVKELSDHFRINFRCGYGKYNYAPVLFIQK